MVGIPQAGFAAVPVSEREILIRAPGYMVIWSSNLLGSARGSHFASISIFWRESTMFLSFS